MKTAVRTFTLVGLLALPAFVQSAEIVEVTHDTRDTKAVAWLGVHVVKVTPVVASQLDLARGVGLTVEHVVEDSPAAKAGLQENDILTRFGDQWLVNPEQFATLVQGREVDDEVELTFRRKGAEQTTRARLARRPPGAVEVDLRQIVDTEKIKTLVNQQAKLARDFARTEWPKVQQAIRSTILNLTTQATVLKDDTGTLTLTRKDGRKHLKAEDPDGGVLFEGPIESEAELEAVPPEIRKKVETMELPPPFELEEVQRGLREARDQLEAELQELRRDLEQLKQSLKDRPATSRR